MLGQKRFADFSALFDFVFTQIDHSKAVINGDKLVMHNVVISALKDVLRNQMRWREEDIKKFLTASAQTAVVDYYHAHRKMVVVRNIMREETDSFNEVCNQTIDGIGRNFIYVMDQNTSIFPHLMVLCYRQAVIDCNNVRQLSVVTEWLRDQLEQNNVFERASSSNMSVDALHDIENNADEFWRQPENIFLQADFKTLVNGVPACISFQWTSSTSDIRITVDNTRLC